MRDDGSDEKSDLGRRLAVLRAAHGLEQQELAQRAGVDSSSLSRIEQGKRAPEPETRSRLLEALRVSASGLERAGWLIAGVAKDTEGPAAPERAAVSLGFAVEDRARARLTQRAAPAPPVLQDWADLKTLAVEELRAVIEDTPELQTTAFWEALCGESEKVARADARQAAALAELALGMAEWIPLDDEAQRPAYRGTALAYYGNTLRVQGQLPRAEQAFRQADAQWQAGFPAGPALDGSRLLDLRASLLFHQRHVSEALGLLDEALKMGPKGPAARARILIKKARFHEVLRQPEAALGFLEQAAPLLDQEPEPLLVYSHRNLVVGNLWLAGHVEEAERRLGEVQALAAELGNDLDQLRLRWLEAWIDAALGRRLAAIEKMRGVRADFQARKIPFDTALATLELSALLLEQGETAEVKELAAEMLETFAEQGVPQEAEKALRLFCEAAVQETATVELVRRVLGEVGRR
jgi:transcriptional regulator with XRE-family HTH domain